MAKEPISKEEAIREMNEIVDSYYDRYNMELGENMFLLIRNLAPVYSQMKTDEELDELNKTFFKSCKKNFKKEKKDL